MAGVQDFYFMLREEKKAGVRQRTAALACVAALSHTVHAAT